jgi:hypothetical protein
MTAAYYESLDRKLLEEIKEMEEMKELHFLHELEVEYQEIAATNKALFARWRREDPVMSALFDGTMLWGDIPGICDPPVVKLYTASTARAASVVGLCSPPTASAARVASVVKLYSPPTASYASVARAPRVATSTPEESIPEREDGIKTLIVRNLPRDVSVQRLSNVFGKYGPIDDIYIPRNMDRASPYYNTIKGFAFIKFIHCTHAASAYLEECGDALGPNKIAIEFANRDR